MRRLLPAGGVERNDFHDGFAGDGHAACGVDMALLHRVAHGRPKFGEGDVIAIGGVALTKGRKFDAALVDLVHEGGVEL